MDVMEASKGDVDETKVKAQEATKVKVTEEPPQADDESSNVTSQPTATKKRKRKRATGEKGKRKKSKKGKSASLRRNIR
jgi:hypothetical protein